MAANFKTPANTSTALPTPPLSGPDSEEPPERAQHQRLKTGGNEEDEKEEELERDDAEEDEDEERSPSARNSPALDDENAIIVHKRPFRQHTDVEHTHTAPSSSRSPTPANNYASSSISSVSASPPALNSHAHSRAARSRTRTSSRPSKYCRRPYVEVSTWKAIQQERVREARLRRQAAALRAKSSSRSVSASVDRGSSGIASPAPSAPVPTEPVVPDVEHEQEHHSGAEEHAQQSDPDSEPVREEERQVTSQSRHRTEDAAIGALSFGSH